MDKTKMKKWFLVIGSVVLALSIACFVFVSITSGKVEESIGYKPTAEEIEELMNNTESLAEMFDMTLAEAAEDLLGVSAASVKMLQLSLLFRIPLLVVGLICIAIGAAFHFIKMRLGDLQREGWRDLEIRDDVIGSSIHNTEEKVTVKCPNCGTTFDSGLAFCPQCGAKFVVQSEKRYCIFCGAEIVDGARFCGVCGAAVAEKIID